MSALAGGERGSAERLGAVAHSEPLRLAERSGPTGR